jgi:hypothetical protein
VALQRRQAELVMEVEKESWSMKDNVLQQFNGLDCHLKAVSQAKLSNSPPDGRRKDRRRCKIIVVETQAISSSLNSTQSIADSTQ